MGMGRPWNPPGRCQRRRRRDVDGGASGTTRRASLATVRSLLACHRSWRGRAVLQGPRRRRRNPAGVRMQKCDPPGRGEGGLTALLQWLFFQVGHIGPMVGQLWYFKVFAPEKDSARHTRKQAKKGTLMSPAENVVTVVWDTWLKSGVEAEGLRLTRQVWSDMRSFDGYVSHQILIDQDAPGHIIALAKWRSREDADAVREKYKDSATIRRLTPLLARPRNRWVTSEDQM